jgi:hypothetical protein
VTLWLLYLSQQGYFCEGRFTCQLWLRGHEERAYSDSLQEHDMFCDDLWTGEGWGGTESPTLGSSEGGKAKVSNLDRQGVADGGFDRYYAGRAEMELVVEWIGLQWLIESAWMKVEMEWVIERNGI